MYTVTIIISSIIFIAVLFVINFIAPKVKKRWTNKITESINSKENLSAIAEASGLVKKDFINTVFTALLVLLNILLVFLYTSFVLASIESTAKFATDFANDLSDYFKTYWEEFIDFLPNALRLITNAYVTYLIIRLLKIVRDLYLRDKLHIKGFKKKWATSTYFILATIIIIIMINSSLKFFPGFGTNEFNIIIAITGLLTTFASQHAISNMIAGMVLLYGNYFDVGDRIEIGDIVGDVVKLSISSTTIVTLKNETIVIPNNSVLNNNYIKNYTARKKGVKLIIHRDITIGYDVEFIKVHNLLINSAKKVEGILDAPSPFVLTKSLDNSYISYEINGYINDEKQMVKISTALNHAILQAFEDAGVEILSPSFVAVRNDD